MEYKIHNIRCKMKEQEIFKVGKRNENPKRSFLFISKLLGKHLAVNPETVRATGYLLSSLKYGKAKEYYARCIQNNEKPNYGYLAEDKDMLVIGFCETATGLGMAVASSIRDCSFQTTTREKIRSAKNLKKVLSFEEEHSHATTHNMLSDIIRLEDYRKITLVDDEITTGKSLLNLMEQIEKISHKNEYNIMTILDWRGEAQRKSFKQFEEDYNTSINVYSLADGNLSEEQNPPLYINNELSVISRCHDDIELDVFDRYNVETDNGVHENYVRQTGKFGVAESEIRQIEEKSANVATEIIKRLGISKNDDILVIGHGENIYIPSRIASYIQAETQTIVQYRTTTRSPIYCDGEIIKDAVSFTDRGEQYYFYNTSETEKYSHVIMLNDVGVIPKLCAKYISYRI